MEPFQEIEGGDHVDMIARQINGGEDADEISKGAVHAPIL